MDVSRDTLKMIFGQERLEDDFQGIIEELIKNPEGYRQKVIEYYENVNVENPEICKECGGVCCKRAPCHWSPKDIENLSYRSLKKLLRDKQYISVYRFPRSVCESSFREVECEGTYFYILRTRTRGTGIAAIATNIRKDDRCMLLGSDGCALSFKERPMGARLLIPARERKCKHLYDLDDCIYDWKDHQIVLRKLFHYFRRVDAVQAIINNVHL